MQKSPTTVHIADEDCWGHSLSCFIYSYLKQWVANILPATWDTLLYGKNCNYDSYKLSWKFDFKDFLSFCKNQNQESNILANWRSDNEKYFFSFWYRVALYLKSILNSIGFCRRIFFRAYDTMCDSDWIWCKIDVIEE